MTTFLTTNTEEKAAISKIVSSAFDKCSHPMAILFRNKIAAFYESDWKRNLNEFSKHRCPLENVERKRTLRSKLFNKFKASVKRRLPNVVKSLNNEVASENVDIMAGQFVSFKFKRRKFFGKAEKVIYERVSDQIACDDKFKKFSIDYLSFVASCTKREGEVLWGKTEFYNRRYLRISIPRVSINVIVDAEGNNCGSLQMRPASEVQIVGIDEVLGALTLMLTKM